MIRRLALSLALALVALAGAAPAHADDELGWSTDGIHWQASYPGTLFPDSIRWVPGDVRTASFYVRNQGPTDGQMTVNAFADDAHQLIASGAMTVAARIGNGAWTTLQVGQTRVLPAVLDVARNASSKVTVRVGFDPSTTNQMTNSFRFRLRILMFQGDVKGVGTGNGNGNGNGNGHGGGQVGGENIGNGGLPNTGSPVTRAWFWIAALLIGSGLALVGPRRRREAEDA